jgi:hypothetical protein
MPVSSQLLRLLSRHGSLSKVANSAEVAGEAYERIDDHIARGTLSITEDPVP